MWKRVSGAFLISFSGFSVGQRCHAVNGGMVEMVNTLIQGEFTREGHVGVQRERRGSMFSPLA